MKIFVLGSKGMLGRYVYTYLKQYYTVIEINRNEIDCSGICHIDLIGKLISLGVRDGDVIINCVGTIKPRVDELGELNAILVNSVFPRILANSVKLIGAKLIHPTTDCVFSGKKGLYLETDVHDVYDVYGRTKSLGEPNNCTVIRTSIIGEEVNQTRSLVEWIKSSSNKTINGFTDHLWNGITCLQFAKVCKQIIDENKFWLGIRHIYSNVVNKYELSKMINDAYDLNITINPVETNDPIDRTLSSIKTNMEWVSNNNHPKFDIPPLINQIKEMKNYKIK